MSERKGEGEREEYGCVWVCMGVSRGGARARKREHDAEKERERVCVCMGGERGCERERESELFRREVMSGCDEAAEHNGHHDMMDMMDMRRRITWI